MYKTRVIKGLIIAALIFCGVNYGYFTQKWDREIEEAKRSFNYKLEEIKLQKKKSLANISNDAENEVLLYQRENESLVQNFKKTYSSELQEIVNGERIVKTAEAIRSGRLDTMLQDKELNCCFGKNGTINVNHRTFKQLTIQGNKVNIVFRNDRSVKCRPSLKVYFYNQFGEYLDSISESWTFFSLSPGEVSREMYTISTYGNSIWYYSFKYSE